MALHTGEQFLTKTLAAEFKQGSGFVEQPNSATQIGDSVNFQSHCVIKRAAPPELARPQMRYKERFFGESLWEFLTAKVHDIVGLKSALQIHAVCFT